MWHGEQIACAQGRLFLQTAPTTADSDSPWLLMLHGVLRQGSDFAPILGSLAARWRIALLDFRGHGRSSRAERYRVTDYVEDALAALRRLEGPVAIYGHSLGAMVAAAAAAEASEQVLGAVLEDPPFDAMGIAIETCGLLPYFQAVERVALQGGDAAAMAKLLSQIPMPTRENPTRCLGDVRDAASIQYSAHCLTQVDPAVLSPITQKQWLKGYNRRDVLSAGRSPLLLLQADTDAGGMLSEEQASEAVDLGRDVRRVRFPEAGHLLHWTHTDQVLAATHMFLETVR